MLFSGLIRERKNTMSLKGIPKNTDVTSIIVEMVKLLRPHTYVELGIKRCWTFNQVAPLVKKAIGVDKLPVSMFVNKNSENTKFYCMTTDAFIEVWEDPIDFAFIDACHDKNQVLKDFWGIFKYLRSFTGLICMHDTYPVKEELLDPGYCGTAWEAASEIRNSVFYADMCEIVTIPGPWFGMSIVRKVRRGKHLGWME